MSLAEISEGAPFSLFPGLDRTAVLAKGGPVLLRGSVPEPDGRTRQWPLNVPGDLARFAGETPMDNTAPEHDALIWNVMARRGHVQATVQVHQGRPLTLPPTGHTLVWVLHGTFHVSTSHGHDLFLLAADEGLHHQGGQTGLSLAPTSPEARLICTQLC